MSDLKWFGAALVEKLAEASKAAIDEVTDSAAEDAKSSHWWISHGHLEDQIISEPARKRGTTISGKFGTTAKRGFYGLFLERERPFLRPAADRTFPELPKKIAERIGAK